MLGLGLGVEGRLGGGKRIIARKGVVCVSFLAFLGGLFYIYPKLLVMF